MDHKTAKKQKLEPIYSEGMANSERYFYDPAEGRYYDAYTDLYFEIGEFDPKDHAQ